jgi:tRNA-Thr(GGU) m(6)t(6)A37 methyltransferase TsaA
MNEAYCFKPVGIVKRDFAKDHVEWNDLDAVSRIEIQPEYEAAIEGLEEYSHIIIFFVFHKRKTVKLTQRPENRRCNPNVGIFCTNSEKRPNPLGMTVVRLLKVEGGVLTVKGLDALDGTPVIDIKPYAGFEEEAPEYIIPDWLMKIWEKEHSSE